MVLIYINNTIFFKNIKVSFIFPFFHKIILNLTILIPRHLGAAHISKCYPDILISESTYATTLRDSKRSRETDFLQ
jgi:hypothetical protein